MAGFTTRTIHALHDVALGAVVPPIHTASTFLQPTEGGEGPFEYQRGSNPTRTDAETTLAASRGTALVRVLHRHGGHGRRAGHSALR